MFCLGTLELLGKSLDLCFVHHRAVISIWRLAWVMGICDGVNVL